VFDNAGGVRSERGGAASRVKGFHLFGCFGRALRNKGGAVGGTELQRSFEERRQRGAP
jgi:hypothetical protein